MNKKLRTSLIIGCLIVAFAVILVVSPYIPAERYWHADDIERAGLYTEYKLADYEQSGNPAEMREWIANGPKDALLQQSYLTLAGWSISHQSEFIRLAESLDKRQEEDFVETFGFVVADSGQTSIFRTAFKASKSKIISAIMARLPVR